MDTSWLRLSRHTWEATKWHSANIFTTPIVRDEWVITINFYVHLIVQAVLVSSLEDISKMDTISNPFIPNYYWTLCRSKAELDWWEISLTSRFHWRAPPCSFHWNCSDEKVWQMHWGNSFGRSSTHCWRIKRWHLKHGNIPYTTRKIGCNCRAPHSTRLLLMSGLDASCSKTSASSPG